MKRFNVILICAVIALVSCLGAVASENGSIEVSAAPRPGQPFTPHSTRTLGQLSGFTADPTSLDSYGGWIGEKQPATGFFYSKQIKGRWWFVDPDGNLFLHIAVNSVGPQDGPTFEKNFSGKFGSKGDWADATAELLTQAGFNGTGAWSDDGLLRQAKRRLVYTPILNWMSGYGRLRGGETQQSGHSGYPENCIFVFDAKFSDYVEGQAKKLEANKDDPWLLGYMSDNELPFPVHLLDSYLKLPADDPGHVAAQAWLAQHPAAKGGPIDDDQRDDFRGFVTDKYFSICAAAIKRHDPNHLYLGSRLYGISRQSPAIFKSAGKYLDAVTVNIYGNWSPRDEIARLAGWAGKPIVVTEWYAKGQDSGMKNDTGAGWLLHTQADRGKFYQNFTLDLLESKGCAGWHWFEYADNDPANTHVDPSNRNSNKGIINSKYEPYEPLISAMTELNHDAYSLTGYFDKIGH